MKASELITRLQEMIDKHGDLVVNAPKDPFIPRFHHLNILTVGDDGYGCGWTGKPAVGFYIH